MVERGNPLWERLKRIWISEQRPGVVICGNKTYQVNLLEGEENIKFMEVDKQDYYQSTTRLK